MARTRRIQTEVRNEYSSPARPAGRQARSGGALIPRRIVIPDTAAEKPVFGKVIAVGKGKILESGETRALDVCVGDKILFGKYSGTEVKVNGEDLVVMREEDVMGVVG
jgi:chaperonin GroES